MPTSSLDALKARLPDYLQSLGLEPRLRGGHKLSCRCPLHADSKPSFTATQKNGVWLWHCFPCAKGGTIIDLHAALLSTDSASAIRDLLQRYEAPLFAPPARPAHVPVQRERECQPKPWPILERGGESDFAELAALRGLPIEAVRIAHRLGCLRFTVYHGTPCYALTDGEQKFLQLRRLDGAPFPFPKDKPIKAWNWPGCRMVPLGILHLDSERPVLMAEGAVSFLELLALLHLTHGTQDSWRWAILAMPGASARIPDALLPKLQGRQIRIIGDRDDAGQRATQLWADQCRRLRCDVDLAELSALPELDHPPKADLGDLLRLAHSTRKTEILNTLTHL
jgi:hypothetical protein